jgi:hypothetical protein
VFALTFETAGQSDIQFSELYNCEKSSMYYFKVLECENEKYCKVAFMTSTTPRTVSFESEVAKSKILDAFKAGGCTINGKPLESVNNTTRQENKPESKPQQNAKINNAKGGRFKVGERVKASPMSLSEEEYFENCTVIKDYLETEGFDTYRVRCDDPKGGIGKESNVKVPFIRAWANATAAPNTPECPFNEPAGTVNRASKPSAELFKRVIFEKYRDISNGRQVGITYQSFQMGAPYKNVVMSVPGRGVQLKHDGAPEGATIYPLKTKYLFCDKYTDSTLGWVIESQFACFKDKFGNWVCPVDSVPKYLEQIYLPNK